MTPEEKAKRYDEAIKKAKTLYENANGMILKKWVEQVFPELIESEDDKIREELISYLDNFTNSEDRELVDKFIAWLEKQVPVCLSHDDEIMIRQLTEYFTTGKGLQNTNDTVVEWLADVKRKLEKQGEQKSIDNLTQQEAMDIAVAKCFEQSEQKTTDMVEPKFNEGDFIVNKDGNAYKVVDVCNAIKNEYLLRRLSDNEFVLASVSVVDRQSRLWDITKDVNDGDVLVTGHKNIFIFKSISGYTIYDYCGLYFGKFEESASIVNSTKKLPIDYVPATKEQCDLLFSKMKEAGYEWDAEKKELKKIEQKPAEWSEDDEQYLLVCKNALRKYQVTDKWDSSIISQWLDNKLKSLRPQPKQEWSEEDEARINNIISVLNVQVCWDGATGKKENPYQKEINWLKSLKERVIN